MDERVRISLSSLVMAIPFGLPTRFRTNVELTAPPGIGRLRTEFVAVKKSVLPAALIAIPVGLLRMSGASLVTRLTASVGSMRLIRLFSLSEV